MNSKTRRVIFADAKLEKDYNRLKSSTKKEERKLYATLTTIKAKLLSDHTLGTQLSKRQIPDVYKRMFQVKDLWKLDLSPKESVLYDYLGEEIRIVDVV